MSYTTPDPPALIDKDGAWHALAHDSRVSQNRTDSNLPVQRSGNRSETLRVTYAVDAGDKRRENVDNGRLDGREISTKRGPGARCVKYV